MQKAVLLVHGGTSKMLPEIYAEHECECKEALSRALQCGYEILKNGGTSIDTVETAIKILEDCPYFNAGKGAVIADSGLCELDASIMDGKTKKAGAVANVTLIKNPIAAARAVMEKAECILIAGEAADIFAREQKLETVDRSYFLTPHRLEQLEKAQAAAKSIDQNTGSGTVGAVAVDKGGNLAAGASTGGRINKPHGRIGDSAIIGAGVYADNRTCAVSCTGHGEMFMRHVVAYDIAAQMEYKGLSVKQAANDIIMAKLFDAGGRGGAIVLDKNGNFAMPFNTQSMMRGFISADGYSEIHIYE